jgi:hypothetical protein
LLDFRKNSFVSNVIFGAVSVDFVCTHRAARGRTLIAGESSAELVRRAAVEEPRHPVVSWPWAWHSTQLVGVVSDLRFDGDGRVVLGDDALTHLGERWRHPGCWCAATASGLAVLTQARPT